MVCLPLAVSTGLVSHHKNEKPFSSLKLNSSFCPAAASSTRKSRLAASSADAGIGAEVIPKHLALIIDGHQRWGISRGLTVHDGHKAGVNNINHLVTNCCKSGIEILTLFVFGIQNFERPKVEVEFLLNTLEDFIRSDLEQLTARHNIRFSVIGNTSKLGESLQEAISNAEKDSEANKGMHFVMAINYGGRDDILEATKKIAREVEDGVLRSEDIDIRLFEKHLMCSASPDLLIRVGDEFRLSDFLLWQVAYTEFYFSKAMFPDFGEDHLMEALASFKLRKRRYGSRCKEIEKEHQKIAESVNRSRQLRTELKEDLG